MISNTDIKKNFIKLKINYNLIYFTCTLDFGGFIMYR